MFRRIISKIYSWSLRAEKEILYTRVKVWQSELFRSSDQDGNTTGYIVTPEQMERLLNEVKP